MISFKSYCQNSSKSSFEFSFLYTFLCDCIILQDLPVLSNCYGFSQAIVFFAYSNSHLIYSISIKINFQPNNKTGTTDYLVQKSDSTGKKRKYPNSEFRIAIGPCADGTLKRIESFLPCFGSGNGQPIHCASGVLVAHRKDKAVGEEHKYTLCSRR